MKPGTGTGTCSPKRRASATWLLQPLAGNRTPQACSAIQISGQHGRAGNLCPPLHFWGSSSTSEEHVVQHCRRPEQAEWHRSMGMGVYVKQMLAHFRGMFDRANLDKGARFPGPQDHRITWYKEPLFNWAQNKEGGCWSCEGCSEHGLRCCSEKLVSAHAVHSKKELQGHWGQCSRRYGPH